MVRIILFLILIALAAAGAAWVAEQPGDVVLVSGNLKLSTTLPRFVLMISIVAPNSRSTCRHAPHGAATASPGT